MLKIFISQPMRGLTDEQIKENRQKAIDLLTTLYNGDVEIVNPFVKKDAPENDHPAFGAGQCIFPIISRIQ